MYLITSSYQSRYSLTSHFFTQISYLTRENLLPNLPNPSVVLYKNKLSWASGQRHIRGNSGGGGLFAYAQACV